MFQVDYTLEEITAILANPQNLRDTLGFEMQNDEFSRLKVGSKTADETREVIREEYVKNNYITVNRLFVLSTNDEKKKDRRIERGHYIIFAEFLYGGGESGPAFSDTDRGFVSTDNNGAMQNFANALKEASRMNCGLRLFFEQVSEQQAKRVSH